MMKRTRIFTLYTVVFLIAVMLTGCVSNQNHKVRQYFDNTLTAAQGGSVDDMVTVGNNYCNGNTYTGIRANPERCLYWRMKYITDYPGSHKEQSQARWRWRQNDIKAALVLLEKAYKRGQGQSPEAFSTVLARLGNSERLSHQLGLYAFLEENSAYDPHEAMRNTLSGTICFSDEYGAEDSGNASLYCSMYGDRLLETGEDQARSRAYEAYRRCTFKRLHANRQNFGTSMRNLASLHLSPPDNIAANPEAAIELLNRLYSWEFAACASKNGDDAGTCSRITERWRGQVREAYAVKLNGEYHAARDLPEDIREDQFRLALVQHLKTENYAEALAYFALFDRAGMSLPSSMIFFKAEALRHTQQTEKAKESYRLYLSAEGKKGSYYRKALEQLNRL